MMSIAGSILVNSPPAFSQDVAVGDKANWARAEESCPACLTCVRVCVYKYINIKNVSTESRDSLCHHKEWQCSLHFYDVALLSCPVRWWARPSAPWSALPVCALGPVHPSAWLHCRWLRQRSRLLLSSLFPDVGLGRWLPFLPLLSASDRSQVRLSGKVTGISLDQPTLGSAPLAVARPWCLHWYMDLQSCLRHHENMQ